MPSTPFITKPELYRTKSWPPAIRMTTDIPLRARSGSMSATTPTKPALDTFEDDLEDHPEDHFLSYGYEDWSDEDDEDDEDVVWNAGITDFALFDNDRRRAQETHDRLPSKWGGLLAQQAAALRRSAQRIRADAASDPQTGGLFTEDMPELTPDHSPNLRDNLEDVETFRDHRSSKPSVTNYLTVIVTPPPEEDSDQSPAFDDDDNDCEDPPLSLFNQRAKTRTADFRKMQRPGLRHGRTLSGKAHVWRRPSWDIYPVSENPRAEERAEKEMDEAEVDGWRVLKS